MTSLKQQIQICDTIDDVASTSDVWGWNGGEPEQKASSYKGASHVIERNHFQFGILKAKLSFDSIFN